MNCERAWTSLIQSDSYISAIGVACRSLCDYYPGYMRSLMQLSMGNVSSPCNYLRISSAAILSALITRCPGENNGQFDETILDKVVEELQHFVKDRHLLVRKLAIRGYTAIGTLASSMPNGNSIAQKYAQIAFEAALNGLDDAYDRKDEI
uniref:Tubulin-specific chaperone D n=1 Tax=Panagrolaimus sp. ES5 TaxID=591445 RepID=A0AC34FWD1_9BILA